MAVSRKEFVAGLAGFWALNFAPSTSLAESRSSADAYTHPQELVAVDGARRINLFCIGQGEPTVLFDSGTGGDSLNWRDVQGEIAGFTKSCSYDRAGYGFSDPATRPSDAVDTVDDIHRLIGAARLGGSVVLVGHSAGGLYATLYAATYPHDTGGLVLVDPGFAGQYRREWSGLSASTLAEVKDGIRGFVASAVHCLDDFRAGGTSRLEQESGDCLDDPPNPDLLLHRELNRQYGSIGYLEANVSEIQNLFETKEEESVDGNQVASALTTLGSIPLVVLTAWPHGSPVADATAEDTTNYSAGWREGHEHLAALSTSGSDILLQGSGHVIQHEHPDVVVKYVKQVVDDVRARLDAAR